MPSLRAAWVIVLALGCSSDDDGASSAPTASVLDGGDVADSASGSGEESSAADAAADVGVHDITITVGDLVFDAIEAGPSDGEPVFLLHGFPQTSHEWHRQVAALGAAGYRAIAPDQRGYSAGARPMAVEDYVITNLVQDVLGMADEVGAPRFHLVGHDWGAAVAWLTAIIAPARVASLAPMSVPHLDAFSRVRADPTSCQYDASSYINFFVQPDSHEQFLADDGAGLRGMYSGIAEEDADAYFATLMEPGALEAALHWYRANFGDGMNAPPEVGPVTVPTMYVWSDGDAALCIDGAVLTEEYVDAPYRFEIIEGASHWLVDERPEEVNGLLLDHIGTYPLD